MAEFAARIRRVRIKGGADLHIIANAAATAGGEDWRGAIVRNAKRVAELSTTDDPLVGYLLVGFYANGTTSVGFRLKDDEPRMIPRSLMPAWVAEIVRRDLVTQIEAEETFDKRFYWQDG
jgi:hypothetical protein